jgi:ABC-type glycerol-3-phosphate transport system permease component
MHRRAERIVNAVVVATFGLLLFPFYWMIVSSLKGPEDLLSVPPSLPGPRFRSATFGFYRPRSPRGPVLHCPARPICER